MDAVQERPLGRTTLVEVVDLMVAHYSAIGLGPALKISRNSRMDHRDRDDLVISKMNAAQAALGNRSGIGQRRATDSDNSEQTCGGILDGLLHVLAKVTHPGGLGVQADRRSCVRGSVSQANCRDIGGRYHEFNRIGSGYKISINEGGHRRAKHDGGYLPIPAPARRRKYTPNNILMFNVLRREDSEERL
jgi:hypothetical protein